MYLRVFSKGQGTEWGIFLGLLKFQIILEVLEIPDLFAGGGGETKCRCWARAYA